MKTTRRAPLPPAPLVNGLADPTRSFAILLLGISGVYVLYLFVLLAINLANTSDPESRTARLVVDGIQFAIVGVFLAAVAGMLRLVFRPQVLLLRAFGAEDRDASVRQVLRAGMGRGFRLCGIRQPRRRASWLSRVLLVGSDGVRYLGSDRLDLEAGDHNWLARLLATALRARAVAFDLRQRTENIERELQVLVTALGVSRCLFFVADENERDAISVLVAGLVPEAPAEQVSAATIVVDQRRLVGAARLVRSHRGRAAGGLDSHAVQRAWAIVREQVDERHLRRAPMESGWLRLVVVLAVAVALQVLLMVLFALCGLDPRLLALALNLVSLALLFLACRRLRAIGRAVAPLSKALGESWPTWLETAVAWGIALLGLLQVLTLLLLPSIVGAAEEARNALARVRLREVHSQILISRMQTGRMPTALELWASMAREGPGEQADPSTDPWGNPFLTELRGPRDYEVRSAGADGMPGTADDIVLAPDGSVRGGWGD